jgi:hypothetical protein
MEKAIKITLSRRGMMRTQQAPEHESFVYKDNWRIFDPKDLENFSLHTVQVFSVLLAS